MYRLKNEFLNLLIIILVPFSSCYENDDCRLTNLTTTTGNETGHEGNVEIYYEGHWYPLCGVMWDFEDATVVCRATGYKNGALDFSTNLDPEPLFHYFRYSGFHCTGNEFKLQDCRHETGPKLVNDTAMCGDHAVVVCADTPINYALIFGSIGGTLLFILLGASAWYGYKYIRRKQFARYNVLVL